MTRMRVLMMLMVSFATNFLPTSDSHVGYIEISPIIMLPINTELRSSQSSNGTGQESIAVVLEVFLIPSSRFAS